MSRLGSWAGKCGEVAGLVLRVVGAVAVADCPLCWEQLGKTGQDPPGVGAWLPTYMRGGDRQLERDGIVS